MTPATLSQVAANLRATAGTVNSSNAGEEGYWREIALAAEELAGAISVANALESGYMLRTAVALESIEGTSGAEENRNYPGLLKRIVDAMEAGNGAVGTGSLDNRLRLASEDYTGGVTSPLFTIDLENGAYSIGGVSKTLGDCLWADPDWWGAWDESSVVPGVGLVATVTGTGANSSRVAPGFTEAVKATMRSGYRVDITFTTILPAEGTAGEFLFGTADTALYIHGAEFYAKAENNHPDVTAACTAADFDGAFASTTAPTPGTHTVSFRHSSGTLGVALDGGAEASAAQGAPDAIAVAGVYAFASFNAGGVVTATAIIEKIEGFAA